MNTPGRRRPPPPDTQPPTDADQPGRDPGQPEPDQPHLDCLHGPLGGAAVPGGALPGGGLHQLCRDRDHSDQLLQQHGSPAADDVPIPSSSPGWGRHPEPERLLEHRLGDHAGAANTPPTATISAPTTGTLWNVGDTINFSGSATDTEDGGTLPASSAQLDARAAALLAVRADELSLAHHPVLDGSRERLVRRTRSRVPRVPRAHAHRDRFRRPDRHRDPAPQPENRRPDVPDLSRRGSSSRSEARARPPPFTRTVIEGSNNSVSAPSPQTLGGTVYTFVSWSDGGAAAHNIVANATATYTATYQAAHERRPPAREDRSQGRDDGDLDPQP